jgi:hypothetical protein
MIRGSTGGADLAREEAREAQRLAVAVRPAARRRERHHRASAAALGEFERQPAAHGVADKVRGAHPEFVQVAFEVVGRGGEGQREVAGIGRPAIVSGESWGDHFVVSRQPAQQRTPVVPCAGEAVQEH